LIFAIGGHVVFGNDIDSYSLMDASVITTFAAFFGDWDKDSMMSSETRSGDRSPGAAMWFIVCIIGLGMLSNIFIAVVSEVYNNLKPCMTEEWGRKVDALMTKAVWREVMRQLPTCEGPLDDLLKLLPAAYRPHEHQRKTSQLRARLNDVIFHRSRFENLFARSMLGESASRVRLVQISASALTEDSVQLQRAQQAARRHRQLEHRHRVEQQDAERREQWYALRSSLPSEDAECAPNASHTSAAQDTEALPPGADSGAPSPPPRAAVATAAPDWINTGADAGSFSGSSGFTREYPVCDSRWYDEEVELRFHFSWCALSRFDPAATHFQLETSQDAMERKKQVENENFASILETLRRHVAGT
jgi:hypothetical protein